MANRGAFGQENTGIYTPIEFETFGRVGNSESGEGYKKVQGVPETTRVAKDSGDNTITYVGTAIPNSDTSQAVWRVTKVISTGSEFYADGNALYDNVWDDRESLTYL
jgi:hypothetical protein